MKSEVSRAKTEVYEFDDFRLVPSEMFLLRKDKPITLPPKVFETLVYLVKNNGRLVEKEELLDNLWADTFVEEGTLTRTISRLRKALGEDSENKFIETIPKKGYRFLPTVKYSEKQDVLENNKPQINEKDSNQKVKTDSNLRKKSSNFISLRLAFALGVFFFLILSLVLILGLGNEKNTNDLSSVKSIAVLPFEMIGEEEKDNALKLAMADALIIKFSGLEQIVVRPTSAISKYAGQEIDPQKVGKDLKVDAILSGNIQRYENRLRVTVQITSSTDGKSLWGGKFDVQEKDIFDVQDNISNQVVQALALKLSGKEYDFTTV